MEYRRLGRCGLKVSALSLGSWITYGSQLGQSDARELMAAAWDHGVNFFDNAETYAGGQSETIMGAALRELGWARHAYIVSTKFYWGLHEGPNTKRTLNRKYLLSAIDGSLQRLGLDYVDLAYCHRPDPNTPMEETVWAMHDMITRGKALYWGTSEWSADEIRAAWLIADKHHLHKPVVEQPQYNLFTRHRVEQEHLRVIDELGIGLTTFSPLANGLLTGKYIAGVPEDSRATKANFAALKHRVLDAPRNAVVAQLLPVAQELGCPLSQLAIAWCAKNPSVSSVITGASRVSQLQENMASLALIPQLTPELMARLTQICAGVTE